LKLTDLLGLYAAIKAHEGQFKRSLVGEVVALEGLELRIFGGRWTVSLRRVR
jgi:hypothetical protein